MCVESYPFPRRRPQLGAKPVNISINAKLSVEREPVIGQTLIDMRGRKPYTVNVHLPPYQQNLIIYITTMPYIERLISKD